MVALVGDNHPETGRWHRWPWTRTQPHVRPLVGALGRPEQWWDVPELDGLSGIFHLAGRVHHSRTPDPAMWQVNVEATLQMVRLAQHKRCRLIWVSTSGTVGCSRDPAAAPDESAALARQTASRWPYYHSKIEAEAQARPLASALGVHLVVMRPPMLLGPGDHRLRSTHTVSSLLRGKLPFSLAGGMHFADVRDVAAALLAAMRRPLPQPIYNLPGHASPLPEFLAAAAELGGVSPPRFVLPYPAARALASLGSGSRRRLGAWAGLGLPDPVVVEMARHHWGIGSRFAQTELGYRSRQASATLADTIAWLRQNDPALALPR